MTHIETLSIYLSSSVREKAASTPSFFPLQLPLLLPPPSLTLMLLLLTDRSVSYRQRRYPSIFSSLYWTIETNMLQTHKASLLNMYRTHLVHFPM